MLKNIRIVLVNTSHPGNIGAAARAMKTMGLSTLYLVSPHLFPHDKAIEMASGAVDILAQATVVETLDQAISGCQLVIGTSARSRAIPWPMLTPRECGQKAVAEAARGTVAIVFGREQSGLTNDELHRCHYHVQIPADSVYSSLNVAAAVQILAYEARVANLEETQQEQTEWDYQFASADELARFYVQLEKVLIDLKFLKPEAPRQLMTRLRRLFNRARPDVMEINILRGILGAVEKLNDH